MDIDNLSNSLSANLTDSISNSLWKSIPPEFLAKFSFLFTLAKILFVIIIVYFVFLIIAKLLSMRDSFKLGSIAKNTSEMNDKMDTLISALTVHSEQKARKGKKNSKDLDKDDIKINHFP